MPCIEYSNKPAAISIKEARKILGKSALNLTDEQVYRRVKQFEAIVEAYIISVPKY